MNSSKTERFTQKEQMDIRDIYMEILNTDDLSKFTVKEFYEVLQPDSLLERFAAKKANGISNNKDFLEIKGHKGQIENLTVVQGVKNDTIGFKCLHYSVTESAGTVEITVVKKNPDADVSFGIRTMPNTAKDGSEYEALNKVIPTMGRDEKEKTF